MKPGLRRKASRQRPGAPGAPPDFFSPQVTRARRFYLDLDPPRTARLAVVCGGVEQSAPDYAIERRSFPFYSIEYVARGQGALELKGNTHSLHPGIVFSYGPGVPHRIRALGGETLVKYFVDFTGRQARALLRGCGLGPGQVSQVFPPNAVQGIFDELIESGLRFGARSADLCVALLTCLALKLKGSHTPPGSPDNLAFQTYVQCRRHIEQNYLRLRTLEAIGAECRVSSAHLCRLFARYDRQTPYQFLLRLKINDAAQNLMTPGALVKQVAEQAGFQDPFHFSRVFKQVLGVSPAQFRQLR